MRGDRAAERGAVTVSSASPRRRLFAPAAADWTRVPENEVPCTCVNTICFRAPQLAFPHQTDGRGPKEMQEIPLHLSEDSTKTLRACAATWDLTFIVKLSPSCRGLQFHVRTFIGKHQALRICGSNRRKYGLICPCTVLSNKI